MLHQVWLQWACNSTVSSSGLILTYMSCLIFRWGCILHLHGFVRSNMLPSLPPATIEAIEAIETHDEDREGNPWTHAYPHNSCIHSTLMTPLICLAPERFCRNNIGIRWTFFMSQLLTTACPVIIVEELEQCSHETVYLHKYLHLMWILGLNIKSSCLLQLVHLHQISELFYMFHIWDIWRKG